MSNMRLETKEIPLAVERLLHSAPDSIDPVVTALKAADPSMVVTIARGTSDHAAYFLKYATELLLGLPVASQGPSVASIYGASMKMQSAAVFAISQSGASADIVKMSETARKGGALTTALVNTNPSPLAEACEMVVDLQAGKELALAATKSYVTSIVAGLAILSRWAGDTDLLKALDALPDHLNRALELDWSVLSEPLAKCSSLYMLGRGPTMAIAAEAALKCKETCELHAEAYSAAEVLHGPVSLVDQDFPVIAFACEDAAQASIAETIAALPAQNKDRFISSQLPAIGDAISLPTIKTGHTLTDALALIVPFYGIVESTSRKRGLNPDSHEALNKVTITR